MSFTVTVEARQGRTWSETINNIRSELDQKVNLKDYKVSLAPGTLTLKKGRITATYKLDAKHEI